MIPHFTLRQNKGEYLIIRMDDEFHIIDCNEALTKEKRNTILEHGCSPAEMVEMGLSGVTIPKSDIQALTVTGCGFQDDVIFYLGKRKKLSYWLPQAYEQEKMDDFFRGIPRKMVKTRRRLKGGKNLDWRAREQDPGKLPFFRKIGIFWKALSWGTIVGMFLTERTMFGLWFWAVLLLLTGAVFLNSVYDVYFAFYRWKSDSYARGKGKAVHLGSEIFFLIGCCFLRSSYAIVDFPELITPALIAGALLWIGLFVLCRECREDIPGWLISVFLTVMLCGSALIPHVNHILGPETELQTGTVISKSTTSTHRGGRYYDITIRLPDGKTCTIFVSRADYEQFDQGESMEIEIGTGFFGIEYAMDE